MNVANLQLQGLMMAVASVNGVLVDKGIVSVEELEEALHRTEAALTGDERLYEDLSPAQRDAVCFPLRLLRIANKAPRENGLPDFSELARAVGRMKEPYNDQL